MATLTRAVAGLGALVLEMERGRGVCAAALPAPRSFSFDLPGNLERGRWREPRSRRK